MKKSISVNVVFKKRMRKRKNFCGIFFNIFKRLYENMIILNIKFSMEI